MNIRPLNDRLLIKRIPMRIHSSILIPEIAVKESIWGQVLAVGPGRRGRNGIRISVEVNPGDVVIFGDFVDFNQDGLVMIQEGDIRGVVTNA